MEATEKKFTLILSVESYGEDGAVHDIKWALVELTSTVVEHILLAVSATQALAELMVRCGQPALAEAQFHTYSYDVRFVQADQVTFRSLDDLPCGRTVVSASVGSASDNESGWRLVEGGLAGLLRPDEEADPDEIAYQEDMMFRLLCTSNRAEWEATPSEGDGGYDTWSVDYDELLELAKFLRIKVTVAPVNATISVGRA